MPKKTLKKYLSEQHHPPYIQEKLEELFRLPEKWYDWNSTKMTPITCAEELQEILE